MCVCVCVHDPPEVKWRRRRRRRRAARKKKKKLMEDKVGRRR